jgi:two-component system glycerol uptake and utilization response regulator
MTLDTQNTKILVVDDNPVNIDFLVELLNEYDVRTVLDGHSALEAVEEEKPDLILLDISMPGLNGFEVCKRLKAQVETQQIPIIFLTASNESDSIVHAFKIGGADYIVKPYNTEEVLVRVQTQLKLKQALEMLERQSMFDNLTGIPNRKQFFQDSKKLMQSSRAGIPFHLFMLSIDNFDAINGEFGYLIGDQIIKAIPTIVSKIIKTTYTLYRLEGTHFILIFSPTEEIDDAIEWAYAVQKASERARFKRYNTLSFKLSYRYATSTKEDTSIHQVMQRAHQNYN